MLLLLLLLALRPAEAHEFWLQPDRYRIEPGASVAIQMYVGQNFSGELIGIGSPVLVRAEHYTARRKIDLSPVLPRTVAASLPLRLAEPGTHLIALDTNPSTLTLPADKFTDYLRLEGLQGVLEARAAAGTSNTPGRERFRRNIKTLVNVGAASDTTFSRRTGQRLEIVPTTDPFQQGNSTGTVAFQVFFDDAPLPGALVKLWNRGGPQLVTIERRTDAQGRIEAALPARGEWMASVVHMIPTKGEPDLDWDSYWGNLTFSVGAVAASSANAWRWPTS